MKVKAKKVIYYHGKDRKLVKLRPGQVVDVPKNIVESNPAAFEEVPSPKKGDSAKEPKE